MDDAPSDGPGGSANPPPALAPEVERLFGFESPEWAARLRSALEPPPPGRLGRYEGLVEIGRGGQGEVYRAVQPGTGRFVALKRIAGLGLSPSPALLARFTREVEALTRLSHPSVVSVHALEVIDGHSLLVMEFVDGVPIDRWADLQWAQGDGPLKTILSAFAAVCDGVAHAHQRGVLHRDLKPGNILVNGDGQPKVLDFGIAKMLGEQAAEGAQPVWTVTGFAGTPAYASPEQLASDGAGIDTRSDVYSLGVVLFRMLTGEELLDGGTGLATLMETVRAGAGRAPSGVRPSLPRECDWIVGKATDPAPDRRYQSVESLAEDVRRLLDGRAVLAHPPSAAYALRRAITRRPWTSAGIALALATVTMLGAVAAVQAIRLGARSRDLATALAAAEAQRDLADRERERQQRLNHRLLTATMGAVNNETYFVSTDVPLIDSLYQLAGDLTSDDDDDTVAEIRMRLAFALSHARRQTEADIQFAAAREASERVDAPNSERAARIAVRWSWTLRSLNRAEDALAVIDRAIERAAPTDATIYSATLFWERLFVLNALQRPTDEVLACAAELIRRCDAHPDRASERARAREEAAAIASARSALVESRRWMAEALKIGEAADLDGSSLSRFRAAVGVAEMKSGDPQRGEALLRAAADSRWRSETATGFRAHRYICRHAEALHALGRYGEAATCWEAATLRPLAARKPDVRLISTIRMRLAASRLADDRVVEGRAALALALSQGRTADPGDAAVRDQVVRVEASLRTSLWEFDERVRAALEPLGFLADPVDSGASRNSASFARPNLPPAPRPPPPEPAEPTE